MAHVYKRIKARINRCIENSLELRGLGAHAAENAVVDLCIETLQKAQAEVYAKIAGAEKSLKPVRRSAADAALDSVAGRAVPTAVAPTYGPSTGVREAPAQKLTGMARDFQSDGEDDFRVPRSDLTADEQAAEILQGLRGGSYEHDAAKVLAAKPGWQDWSGENKLDAIEDLARKLEADDGTDYLARPAAAPADDKPQDPANVTF